MHPTPSIILFTVLSGLGFGLLAVLDFGLIALYGPQAAMGWGLAYGLATAGLLASVFHLGRPSRAWLAFSQWRTSWLSREAWAAMLALFMSGPLALAALHGGGLPPGFGLVAGVMALCAVFSTSMIYASLRAVPRWNHWTAPAHFLGFAVAGGAVLAGMGVIAGLLSLLLGGVLLLQFRLGDRRFAAVGATAGTATGLGGGAPVRQVMAPHTSETYVTREMIHVVGRKHRRVLRIIAVLGASVLPAILFLAMPASIGWTALAVLCHLVGAFAARWLFFAEAEHVVGLYYR